jgi:hypothetical protein
MYVSKDFNTGETGIIHLRKQLRHSDKKQVQHSSTLAYNFVWPPPEPAVAGRKRRAVYT